MFSLSYSVSNCFLVCYINNRSKNRTALRRAQGPSPLVDRATDGEVELAVVLTRGTIDVVEAIAPVETQQAKHRQEDADAETCGAFHLEGVEVLEAEPTVTSLEEGQGIDGGLRIQRERITHLQGVLGHEVTTCATRAGVVIIARREGVVAVATHTHQLTAIHGDVVQAITTEIVTVERRGTDLTVEVAQIAKAHTGHHHELVVEFGIPCCLEAPAVHLDPLVFFVLFEAAVILTGKEGIRRRDLKSQLELGAIARIDGLAHRVTRQDEVVADEVELAIAVADIQITGLVVVQIITFQIDALIQAELVVRPGQTTTQTDGTTRHLEPTPVRGGSFNKF